jgi:hypothetical protein
MRYDHQEADEKIRQALAVPIEEKEVMVLPPARPVEKLKKWGIKPVK